MTRALNARIWDREEDDWYIEPEWCSQRLFAVERFRGSVYDPACGTGRVPEAAIARGLRAYGTDIVDRGWAPMLGTYDFLQTPDDNRVTHDNIVTNVPFGVARQFAEIALRITKRKVAMILPTPRLHAAHAWLRDTPLRRIWLMTPRPSMPPGRIVQAGGKAENGKEDFAWLIWERNYTGSIELHWLQRNHPR